MLPGGAAIVSEPRPVLGVIACNRVVESQSAQAVMTRYLHSALIFADAAALLVPAMPELMHAKEIAPRLDGLLLTGTPSNLDPKRYGVLVDDAPGPFDPGRDEMTAHLIEAMLEIGKPVFGICRGFQELNVAFGGTLRRDMAENPELIPHHAPNDKSFNEYFDHIHPVTLEEGGVLKRAYESDDLNVVSVHYQGVDKLGAGLNVEARAPDGVVEAISAEVNGAQVLAVQWHPEWKAHENPESQTFFKLLGRALRGQPLVSR
ncbi:gamma-glutamyl-gamma-aminobutyrate hydrolase family protein [Terricaulis sp.]|uniref:gamma-glutamyl-gamma-aminobutyrate hydrolase family protein n=1 Tax=Terricaulis sp. TaxID=2768686 RepID=UPI002AC7A160|nr:gamma-glutamyl-gamma-aminobutyrate hydrolase family protein [Terricaulis sp.]MDZ4692204.1 gamma-glutamyl-gamma-aminobutyrate hydrolase family protein [Terricaulis sp.]